METAGVTLPVLIERLAVQFDAAPALLFPGASLTYRGLAARSNQYARWGLAHGFAGGETVCLFMPNCAEYVAVWLGLSRIGVTVALINSNLAGTGLAHSINAVAPAAVIVAGEFADRWIAARVAVTGNVWCRVHGTSPRDLAPIESELASLSGEPLLDAERAPASLDSTALYIYTSGTTGLPKAAKVSHYRVMQWTQWFAGLLDTQPQDRMFNCLPLYHSVGGVVAIGATLASGGAVVIRARFSASDFWRDVRDERCTLFQYIGELCRYLLNAPEQELEREHSLRIACGNGLRPEVWERFQNRFKIPRILEYYAATEGNFSLYNCESRPGAIGRIPAYLQHRLPVALLRIDVDSGEPARDAQGFCERCAVDEVGEAVGLIPPVGTGRAGRFEGYADSGESARKLLRHVFEPGDCWYRTGDLMRRDASGFYYFVDRLGDTYRWKGENVSTTEVSSVLCARRGVLDGVVYGVVVPGSDGRAGMAALAVDSSFDLTAFRAEVAERLPSYARPMFLRLVPALAATATFKLLKSALAAEGFDPARTGDSLYFDDVGARKYRILDAALHAAITHGEVRI